MTEALIALGLALCAWVLWLERRVRLLSDERDVLCKMLVGVAEGELTVSITHEGTVNIKTTGE